MKEQTSYKIAVGLMFVAIIIVGIMAADYVRENTRLKRERMEQADSLHMYRAYLLTKNPLNRVQK